MIGLYIVYKEGIELYGATNVTSKKVKQIHTNANVVLLVEDEEQWDQIVVDTVAPVSECPVLKKKIWQDHFKYQGFTGPEDEKLVVLLFTPRRIILHTMNAAPQMLVAETVQFNKDMQILNNHHKQKDMLLLTTVDEDGVAHSHIMMGVFYNPILGFWMSCTAGSIKTVQLERNPHSIITSYENSTGDSFIIEYDISASSDKLILNST
ncbi:MAG: hypothetical protein EZS28_022696 [Streblomastix strix]|uniref:Uncharacterized protein n=1 Tax=Streblomastix strix TaxID=222440 RepID=A0A5J4VGQ2_9EUKA|nr:MAG: hypothetical protein EZS28_022696 [Streblomastix strix]